MEIADPLTATRRALAAYLDNQLADFGQPVKVLERWPVPGETRQPYVVTVTLPTSLPTVIAHLPRKLSFTALNDSSGEYLYSYGLAELPIQLDVWAKDELPRNQLVGLLQAAVNRPPAATLGLDDLPRASRHQGLVLRVTDFYDTLASYVFDHFPRLPEGSGVSQAGAWRATFAGTATLYLVQKDVVSTLKQIVGQLSVNGGAATDVPLSE